MTTSIGSLPQATAEYFRDNEQSGIKKQEKSANFRESIKAAQAYQLPTLENNFNWPLSMCDEFEQSLTQEDVKYFAFLTGGTYRYPTVGATIEFKQEWLNYAKALEKDGLTPADMLLMGLGSSGSAEIWFPPKNAPVEVKKAWCDSIRNLSSEERMLVKDRVFNSLVPIQDELLDMEECSRQVKAKLDNITSYQDCFMHLYKYSEENKKKTLQRIQNSLDMQEIEGLRNSIQADNMTQNISNRMVAYLKQQNIA